MPRELTGRTLAIIVSLGLAAAIAVTYWPVTGHDFVGYDDPRYVSENAVVKKGLTLDGIAWSFRTGVGGNWHPVTWFTHMLDASIWGMKPGGHHASQMIWHTANSILLFLVLAAMTAAPWRSAFVAAAFALHPAHVESVAWVAERKDTLSTFFWMLTLGAYWWYVRRPGLGRYILVFVALTLGLMSKSMLVTMPFVLLLLDYWPLRRFEAPPARPAGKKKEPPKASGTPALTIVMEKVPLLVPVVIISVVTFFFQRSEGAVQSTDAIPIGLRIANAIVSYVAYLGKLVWPANLAVFYPYPKSYPVAEVAGALLLLAAISAAAVAFIRRFPYLFVGWFWYAGTLVPVIGILQVGAQAMADRFTYIPSIGLFIAVAWGVADLVTTPARRIVLPTAAVAVLAVWLVVARMQVGHWENSNTLYGHALEVTSDNYMMHYNYGKVVQDQKKPDEAIAHYLEAARMKPGFAPPHNNLGVLYAARGQNKDAIEHYLVAARLTPNDPDVHNNLANSLSAEGRADEAIVQFREALRLRPGNFGTLSNFALALVKAGRIDEAIEQARLALKLNPRYGPAHNVLGTALARKGKPAEAIAAYREALRLSPNWPPAERRLAWLLATHPDASVRNASEAVRLSRHASQSTGNKDPEMLDTVAAAAAESGQFGEAIETAERALQQAQSTGKTALASEIQGRLDDYRAGRPYRDSSFSPTG